MLVVQPAPAPACRGSRLPDSGQQLPDVGAQHGWHPPVCDRFANGNSATRQNLAFRQADNSGAGLQTGTNWGARGGVRHFRRQVIFVGTHGEETARRGTVPLTRVGRAPRSLTAGFCPFWVPSWDRHFYPSALLRLRLSRDRQQWLSYSAAANGNRPCGHRPSAAKAFSTARSASGVAATTSQGVSSQLTSRSFSQNISTRAPGLSKGIAGLGMIASPTCVPIRHW